MFKSYLKMNKMLNMIFYSMIKLPTPININIWWNLGSILGVTLLMQIISGLFLSMHYCANYLISFESIIHIIQDINLGWFFRLMHMNGASLFFLCMYIHIGRGLYYESYNLIMPWMLGLMIYMLSMATAFMGYVLPWGQMSFWGATVITNLISTIPYIGQFIVEWIWGGFSVSNPTLNRFYSFHFILPFIILLLVIFHLFYIHETGSSNPLGVNSHLYMIPFHLYFTLKDIYGFCLIFMSFLFLILIYPYILMDSENFMKANIMITPIHIQPEWYFLFAYTILRSIPNKLGGVIGLLSSILILSIIPLLNYHKFNTLNYYPINKILYWIFINIIIMLTWLGAKPVEMPYTYISQILTILYFSYFIINPLIMKIWDWVISN